MWRPFVCEGSRAFRVLAATEVVQPAAEQRRWKSNIKMTKVLKKMFDRREGSKRKVFPGPVNTAHQDADINPRRKPVYSEGQKRRAHQVGRVLYDNIVHFVNSGELSPQLAALSVEIVRVKVVPNFSTVNVYWLSSGYEEDETVEALFKQHQGLLRQLLTSNHVLGTIPRINFVRDDSRAHYKAVESLLGKADFGPDFVPTRLDTSIRNNILLRGNVADPSVAVSSLQTRFEQLSFQNSPDSAQSVLSQNSKDTAHSVLSQNSTDTAHSVLSQNSVAEGGGEVGHDKGEEISLREKSADAEQLCYSNSSGSTADALEGHSERAHRSSRMLSRQPSSLDAQQLGEQFLSDATAAAGNVTHSSATASGHQKTDSVRDGFRDDLCKVPHTQLLNKILIRKQKAGTRPAMRDREKQSQMLMPEASSSKFKLLLLKKRKVKGRLKSQSDYYAAGIDGVPLGGREDIVEDDEVCCEELDESSALQAVEDLPHGK